MCGRCSGGMPGPVVAEVMRPGPSAGSGRLGRELDAAAVRRVPERVRRDVLQRLLEPLHVGVELEVVGHVLFERDVRARSVGSWRSAMRSNRSATATGSIDSVLPPPSSFARSSRSPMIASSL